MGKRTGAAALVAALQAEGVDTIFGTVGHGNLAFVDALLDSDIRYVPVLHEQVGAHAADAYFRVSGRVGVVTTTVGPGFTNLATGLGDALLDSSAMVVIAGGVPSDYVGREPLQELMRHGEDEQPQLFRPLSKRVIRVQRAEDLPRALHEAVTRATEGCPGPTILHVPMDFFSTLLEPVDTPYVARTRQRLGPDPDALAAAAEVLMTAERPLLYAGGGAILAGAGAAITALAEDLGVPVATTMSGQGSIPEDHPLALGFTGVVGARPANYAARRTDALIAIGTRFPEMDASSWRSDSFTQIPPAKLVHIDIDPTQIDKIYPATVPLVGDAERTVRELHELVRDRVRPAGWQTWRDELAAEQRAWREELEPIRSDPAFPYEPAHFLRVLRDLMPREAVLVTGVGIRHAVGQHFPILTERSQIVASGFGTMGQEMGAALGAALGRPDVPVVAIVGDGAFMACVPAIPSAVMSGIHAVWIVLNNGGYGSIAIYQSKHFGRHLGTWFTTRDGERFDPDYAEIARAFGARGEKVTAPEQFPDLLRRAMSEPATWVIEVPVTATPRVLGSGHWDVNDILAGPRLARQAGA